MMDDVKYYCKNCKRWTCGAQGTSHEMSIPCGNYIPQTNADKIKQGGNESEIASLFIDFLCSVPCIGGKCKTPDKTCHQCVLDWLKQEVRDDNFSV